jgi:hypothetical protein
LWADSKTVEMQKKNYSLDFFGYFFIKKKVTTLSGGEDKSDSREIHYYA